MGSSASGEFVATDRVEILFFRGAACFRPLTPRGPSPEGHDLNRNGHSLRLEGNPRGGVGLITTLSRACLEASGERAVSHQAEQHGSGVAVPPPSGLSELVSPEGWQVAAGVWQLVVGRTSLLLEPGRYPGLLRTLAMALSPRTLSTPHIATAAGLPSCSS